MSKVIMGNSDFYGCSSELKVFQRGGRKQHKHVFVFSRSLLLNQREPISSKARLLLPIMQIGMVTYAFTLSWDNLCRNSCISNFKTRLRARGYSHNVIEKIISEVKFTEQKLALQQTAKV